MLMIWCHIKKWKSKEIYIYFQHDVINYYDMLQTIKDEKCHIFLLKIAKKLTLYRWEGLEMPHPWTFGWPTEAGKELNMYNISINFSIHRSSLPTIFMHAKNLIEKTNFDILNTNQCQWLDCISQNLLITFKFQNSTTKLCM